ncbi:MAG: 1,6-anhydro-N-acetylmuramyl-L-alanine amidase AmpD [Gammaproteobacteria bacterium]|jgi:N-acetyl-anhydromuramoyl-L-alanine amidase|nr:1,6-anhydro-N-acetylmuramyl-L-alanine amidase AmpD [Gammaproteobacteria bacterium]
MPITLDTKKQWLEDVRQVPSPNCDDRPDGCEIDLVVMHGISLPPNEYGGEYIDQLFTNTLDPQEHPYFAEIVALRVSSHLLVNRKGEITQYVPFNDRAWHAGKSEFQGRQTCNDFSIGIELEGCDDQEYEQVQYQVAANIVRLLRQNWQGITKQRVVGHCDVAPGRKTDPGEAFNWDYFYSLLD